MKPFESCPVCSGELIEREVEKLLRGGVNTAVIRVQADVRVRCGERLYASETIQLFEQIRQKLGSQDVAEFLPMGLAFQVQTV